MSEPGEASSLAVQCVRALLERHGLPKYRQSAWLAKAVGLSYSQAHRRLNGASPWSLEDLAQLAALFGETLADLVARPQLETSVNAVMRIGDETINCRLWLGDAIASPARGSVFARKSRSGWVVTTAADAAGAEAFEIARLEANPAANKRRAVAVLDDDPDVSDSIAGNFELLGYDAVSFYKAGDLLAAAAKFDCFVLDWVVGDGTVLELVRALRSDDPSCPIVILTAQVASGAIDEVDIADAMKRYDLLFCEKPVRASILAAMLSRSLALRADRPQQGAEA